MGRPVSRSNPAALQPIQCYERRHSDITAMLADRQYPHLRAEFKRSNKIKHRISCFEEKLQSKLTASWQLGSSRLMIPTRHQVECGNDGMECDQNSGQGVPAEEDKLVEDAVIAVGILEVVHCSKQDQFCVCQDQNIVTRPLSGKRTAHAQPADGDDR